MDSVKRISLEQVGHAKYLTLVRPEKLNALDQPMVSQLTAALEEASRDRDCRAVVLRGAGRAFCAGADLRAVAEDSPEASRQWTKSVANLFKVLRELPMPSIAVVQGYALGAGAGLALTCDFVVMVRDAQIGFPEVERGLVPALTMIGLEQLVGRRRALELVLLARWLSGEEAASQGLVTASVKSLDEANQLADQYVDRIAEMSPIAERLSKRFMLEIQNASYAEAAVAAQYMIEIARNTPDAREGASAFAERRLPSWRNA